MRDQDLAKLGVFLVGAFRLPAAISFLAIWPVALPEEPFWAQDAWAIVVVPGASLLLTLSFLIVPAFWARLVFPHPQAVGSSSLSYQGVSQLVFALVGLALLVTAVPELVEEIVRWQQGPNLILTSEQQREESAVRLPVQLSLLAKLAIGALLLLGSRGLASAWRAARQAGRGRDAV